MSTNYVLNAVYTTIIPLYLYDILCSFRVLPTSISPETASTLYIQHDDVTEQSIIKTKNRPEVRTYLISFSEVKRTLQYNDVLMVQTISLQLA